MTYAPLQPEPAQAAGTPLSCPRLCSHVCARLGFCGTPSRVRSARSAGRRACALCLSESAGPASLTGCCMVQAPERAATAIASSRAAHESARTNDVARRTAEPTEGHEKDGRRARARCRMPKRSAAPRAAAATPRCAARPRPARPAAARPRRPPRRPGTRGGTPASPAACRAVARPRRHQPSPACATRRHRLTMEGCLRSARAPLQHDDSKVWFAHLLQPLRRP